MITELQIELLRANDYNPNRMTEAEFEELVAEVRYLGHLPKPVIVRKNGAGYVIVDGEHGWRAAQEVGQSSVLCELETQAQRLRSAGRAVPAELAATIERGRRAYQNAIQQMEMTR